MYTVSIYAVPKIIKPDGWAAGTTGGGNATPKVVKSSSELKKAVSGSSPAVIIVEGMLKGGCSIGSNKTIVGANSSSGITGGSIKSSGKNIIIQNLSFGPANVDVMEFVRASNIFITKCEFHDCGDELLTVKTGTDKVTISWCRFYFNRPHAHAFGHLVGSGDGNIGDRGKLRITFHHNWYDKGVKERMPRVRFGKVHIYNNYYVSDFTNYVIGVGVESQILLEGSYFKDQGDQVFFDWRNGTEVKLQWTDDNIFINSTIQDWAKKIKGPSFTPPYKYTVDKAEDVPEIVTAGAGNVHGNPVSINHSVNSGNSFQKSNLVELINSSSSNPKLVFNLDNDSEVGIAICDIRGKTITTIIDRQVSAGSHTVQLNRSNLAKGVYYLKIQANATSQLLKICNY
jgi:pectate lyase